MEKIACVGSSQKNYTVIRGWGGRLLAPKNVVASNFLFSNVSLSSLSKLMIAWPCGNFYTSLHRSTQRSAKLRLIATLNSAISFNVLFFPR